MLEAIYIIITTAVIAWISGLVGAYIYRKGYTGQSVFEKEEQTQKETVEWDDV